MHLSTPIEKKRPTLFSLLNWVVRIDSSIMMIALIKPQFELNKREIGKNGIISDYKIHQRICNDFKKWFEIDCNMKVVGIIPSPIKVSKGNIEFLIYAKRNT